MITGGCLCRAVRYEIASPPVVTRVCWCRLCQYIGAGSATVNVCFKAEDVVIKGELSDYECIAESGNRMHRGFCPKCGTPVTSAAESRPHLIFLRAGTLDDPEIAKPSMTIWTKAAPDWACIDPDLPMIEGQAPPAA